MQNLLCFIILTFLSNSFMAQGYTQDWQEVEALLQKRLPKSAYDKTNAIIERAIAANHQEQIVKAILYSQNLSAQLEEIEYDSRSQKQILFIENNLHKVHGPAKSILWSFLGDKYFQYLDQNHWQITNRTRNTTSKDENLSMWTAEDIESKAKEYYIKSIEDESISKVNLTEYKELISNTPSPYCQNLYDFLVRRAINALSNDRYYITEPSNSFTPLLEHFSELNTFVNTSISVKENSSKKYWALRLYQDILDKHINDPDPTILLDIELQRLHFVYNNINSEYKTDLYKKNLQVLFDTYKRYSQSYYALLELAKIIHGEGTLYQNNRDTAYQWSYKMAITLCDQIINECTDESIKAQAKNFKNQIKDNIHFSPILEKVYLPNKPILAHINYTNISKIYYRVYPKNIDLNNLHEYVNDQKAYFKKIFKQNVLHQSSVDLTQPGDYFNHSTEIDLPPLRNGNYTILFSKDADFGFSGNLLHSISISVSNLAYFIHKDPANSSIQVYSIDRSEGRPIQNVEVELHQSFWTQRRESRKITSAISNANGLVQFSLSDYQNQNYFYILKKGDDILYELQEEYFYKDYNHDLDPIYDQYALFLDREIYRPGQVVYFKGIAYQTSRMGVPKILANKDIEVIFRDANSQEISKLSLKTNDYGSFHGSLTAPKGGLLGQMTMTVNNNSTKLIRVEEYKRPTFEIMFDTFSQQVILGQEVSIFGKGKAYSGANLPNANIKYRVTRETRYPYWRCWWIPRPSESKQIAFGESKTDENGKFSVKFTAEPGKENSWDKQAVYDYIVHIEMTDGSGEMQIGSTQVSIGKVGYTLSATVESSYTKRDVLKIPLSIRNLNGQMIDKKVNIKITKLIEPAIVYQARYWDKPEFYTLSESEFRTKFPTMPYGNEDRIENYKQGGQIWSNTMQATKSQGLQPLILDAKKLSSGAYKLTLSATERDGKDIHIDYYFTIHDESEVSKTKAVSILNTKNNYQPGEKTSISIAGSQTNQKIWYAILRNKQLNEVKWSENKNAKVLIDVIEQDRGGFYILWTSVWNNRFYTNKEYVEVPYTNKELDIEYLSFRDKLAPGQPEEWRIKIKGKKGDKVMAEVLANMYDQSLDAFAPNSYSFFPYNTFQNNSSVLSHSFQHIGIEQSYHGLKPSAYHKYESKVYPYLIWMDNYYGEISARRGSKNLRMAANAKYHARMDEAQMEMAAPMAAMVAASEVVENDNRNSGVNEIPKKESNNSAKTKSDPIKVRTNLNETVFFMPNLQTDAEGNVVIKFKMNEALTKWKFMAMATTKELQIGISDKSIVTQKDLMIQPNAPRFMRENDEIAFTARVTNITDKKQSGWAMLELINAENGKSVNTIFGLNQSQQMIDIESGQTKTIEWKLIVPEGISALTYRVLAKAGNISDGEENTIPVITDRMIVTETLPFHLKANSQKAFDFKEMTEKSKSSSLQSKVYTLEYSSNPIWYAIQSLPYLMEYPYECTEQIFSRYFANALSSHIIQKFPKIQSVFESWKGTDAMLSNLTKNQELKSALLEETPWVLDAQSEEEQRKNISVLFDLNRLANEEKSAIDKLHIRQSSDGSFPWFPGGEANPYMTQYVLEGLGHLKFLGVKNYEHNEKAKELLSRGVAFIDQYIVRHYEEMKKWVIKSKGSLKDDHLDAFAIHYLYTRSFFDQAIPSSTQSVVNYYTDQGRKYWVNKGLYQQGMLALVYHRSKALDMIPPMLKSFRERAKVNEEKGMYWDSENGYMWYELPIETHSLMTEVFEYLSENQSEKDNLKLYLLKNKQTNRWQTTKATASAIYALLGGKNDRLELPKMPIIQIGGEKLDLATNDIEQGTGYIKKVWKGDEIQSSFSKIEVANPNPNVSWGAIYWQYLEKLNAINSTSSTPLKVQKKLFIIKNTNQGEVMEAANDQNITIGTKVRVRLTLMVEREMEFLHLKDMRSAGFEPTDAISGYKWSAGLGYYQTSRDASMNFFIDKIYKGTYILEYDLKTNLKGKFSNGITSFQSMYAPEFNSHSQGQEVIIR